MIYKTKNESMGWAEASLIECQAKNESEKKLAVKMKEIAQMKSDTIEIVANGEGNISKVMTCRRKYEHLNAKTEVIKAFQGN
jgi:hypothetical protein